ncbi:MAG: hypothetical protein AUJ18_04090 [Candidatus Hydrogenedentes bacterium CG1_02_42_14]|nr:MAG: hypothetical protein AUJ18_04090 [Candidatus Hydrogenedentes bacterium CG1_02_42_14]
MVKYRRILDIKLPIGQSAFLWGPRKTGKSTYIKSKFPNSIYFDFLKTDLYLEFSKKPFLLREILSAKKKEELKRPIILDEVQKVPQIFDEIHWLIENKKINFILCGSSARKLKRNHTNMLGGRAWRYQMHPLVSQEIKNIDLLKVLNQGTIPVHYQQDKVSSARSLQAYVEDYLKEEVFEEGLVRNIPAFSRFFDAMAYSHCEMINYANIARDSSIDAKTVKEYFQILSDTLLATLIEPFKKRQCRQVISKASKFYLFDTGVSGYLTKRHIEETRGEQFGKAFEHFIFNEIYAYRSYRNKRFEINYWRTKSGLEVDFILGGGKIAIEVKSSDSVDSSEMRPLNAFIDDNAPSKAIIVCNEKYPRIKGNICVLPWRIFLAELWSGKII